MLYKDRKLNALEMISAAVSRATELLQRTESHAASRWETAELREEARCGWSGEERDGNDETRPEQPIAVALEDAALRMARVRDGESSDEVQARSSRCSSHPLLKADWYAFRIARVPQWKHFTFSGSD